MASVDDRIVSMKFDNQSFQSRIQSTIDSLEKLKKSLDFGNSTKGLNDLSNASKSFSLDGIATAVDSINTKFSAMGAVAFTVISNITNQALNAGVSLAKSLSVDQITQGYQEYETNINSIQTILANTDSKGTKLEDVNKALDELNQYSDQTIYNFSEMTRNIGTFTAAGVDLDTSVASIKGIANLAAISGSNSQQASTAMYQLSQALAAGSVKLMDWNSIVNAGMGGEVFQKALFETGKSLHTIEGVDLGTTFEEWKAAGNTFRGSLEDGWLTADVLTNTLQGFTGDLSEAQLTALGYTAEQAKEMMRLGTLGKDAATKVKTLTQLLSTVKESVASGWSASFRTIFGDFEEARELFTGWSTAIGNVVSRTAEARNKILGDWKALGGRTDLIAAIGQIFKDVATILKPIKEAFREIFPRKTGEDLARLTKNFLLFTQRLQASPETVEKVKRVFKGLFAGIEIIVNVIKAAVRIFKELIGVFVGLGGSGGVGIITKIADALVSLNEKLIAGQGIERFVQTIFGGINWIRARVEAFVFWFKTAFSDSFGAVAARGNPLINIAVRLGHAFGAIREAFGYLKDGLTGQGWNEGSGIFLFMNQLGMLLGGNASQIKDGFLKTIVDGFSAIGDALGWVWDRIKSFDFSLLLVPFSLLWDGIQLVGRGFVAGIKGIAGGVAALAQAIGSFAGSSINTFKSFFTDTAVSLDKFDSNFRKIKVSEGLRDFKSSLHGASEGVASLKSSFSGSSNPNDKMSEMAESGSVTSTVFALLGEYMKTLGKILGPIGNKIGEVISKISLKDILAIVATGSLVKFLKSVRGAFEDFGSVFKGVANVINSFAGVFDGVKGVLNAFQTEIKARALIKVAIAIAVLAGSLALLAMIDPIALGLAGVAIGSLFALLQGAITDISKIATTPGQVKDIVFITGSMLLLAGAVFVLSMAVKKLSKLDPLGVAVGTAAVVGLTVSLAKSMKTIMSDKDLRSENILKIAISMFAMADSIKKLGNVVISLGEIDPAVLARGMGAVGTLIYGITKAIKNLPKKDDGKIVGLLGFAFAIRILAWSVRVLGEQDPLVVAQGLTAVGIAIAGIVTALNFMPEKGLAEMGTALLGIGIGLAAIAVAVSILGFLDLATLGQGMGALTVTLGLLAVALTAMTGTQMGAVAVAAAAGAFLLLAIAFEKFGKVSIGDILKGLLGMVGVLVILGIAIAVLTAAAPALAPVLIVIEGVAVAVFLVAAAFALLGVAAEKFAKAFQIISKTGKTGIGVFKELLAAIVDMVPGFIRGVADGLEQLITMVIEMAPKFVTALVKIVIQLLQGIRQILPELAKTVGEIIDTLLKLLLDKGPDILKAGFQFLLNFLKGIADNIKDIADTAVDIVTGFIDAVAGRADDIVASAINLLKSFAGGILDNIQELVGVAITLIRAFLQGMTASVKELTEDVKDLIIAIGEAIVGLAQTIAQQATNIITAIIDAMADAVGDITESVKGLIVAIGKAIIDTMGQATQTFIDIVDALFENILKAQEAITNGTGDFILAVLDGISDAIDKYSDDIAAAGGRLAAGVVEGAISSPLEFGKAFVGGLWDAVTGEDEKKTANDAGQVLGEEAANGFGVGVDNKKDAIKNSGRSVWNLWKVGYSEASKTKSPSREAMKLAGFAVDGFVMGIDGKARIAEQSGARFSQSVLRGFGTRLSSMADELGNLNEFNPTIAPVLDLTSVERDAGRLTDILGGQSLSAGLSARQASSISAAEAARLSAVLDTPQAPIVQEVKFEQNIHAPTQLTPATIYRQTKSQIELAKEELFN